MARCSAVWPTEPRAFMTSASVFHSFVFSSSLKSWSTVVGLVPSKRTRTLSFFFMSDSQSAVILSGAKLQRSGQGPRGQAFNLRSDVRADAVHSPRYFASLKMTMTTDYLVRLNLPVKR